MSSTAPARVHGWDALGWRLSAACRDCDTELFFPAGTTGIALDQIDKAKSICRSCDVQNDCLEFSLNFQQEFGIWGGTTEDERRAIRRAWRARRKAAREAAVAASNAGLAAS